MKRNLFNLMAIVAIAGATLVACKPTQEPTDETNRNWSEDGGLRAADNPLFGDTIGNGDDESVFTGTQALNKDNDVLHR